MYYTVNPSSLFKFSKLFCENSRFHFSYLKSLVRETFKTNFLG